MFVSVFMCMRARVYVCVYYIFIVVRVLETKKGAKRKGAFGNRRFKRNRKEKKRAESRGDVEGAKNGRMCVIIRVGNRNQKSFRNRNRLESDRIVRETYYICTYVCILRHFKSDDLNNVIRSTTIRVSK